MGYEKREINHSIVVFYVFKCKSLQKEWTISKRFSAFVKLYKTLKMDPYFSKKSIPKLKKTFEDDVFSAFSKKYREDEQFIRRRGDELALFVLELISKAYLRKSTILTQFFNPKQQVALVSLQSVIDNAQVGDLILFRTPGIVHSSYRAMIDGDWDHIGIV